MHMDANEGVRPQMLVLVYDKLSGILHGGRRLSYIRSLQVALKCSPGSETEQLFQQSLLHKRGLLFTRTTSKLARNANDR